MKGRLEIMTDSFFCIEPKFLLATRAVGELSKSQPPISRDLRALMAAWALGLVLEEAKVLLQELLKEDLSAGRLAGAP
ncbi:UNVERIFIED_CONTAM: hypothetical protein K2H54_012920 [Gekko kuhli]